MSTMQVETPSQSAESINWSYSEVYVRSSIEDYYLVRELENEERTRRVGDFAGESVKQFNAKKVSDMFAHNTRPTWFSGGSNYFFEVLGKARQSGAGLLEYSQVKASQMTADFSDFAGKKSYEASEDLRKNIEVGSKKGLEAGLHMKELVEEKAFVVTSVLSDKAGGAAAVASASLKDRLDATAHNLGVAANDMVHKTAEKVKEASLNAKEVAKEQLVNVNTVTHQAALKVRSLSSSLLGKVNQAMTDLTLTSQLAYISIQEDTERAYRLSSENEVYAILNGLAVSNLIKNLGWEFYRPTSEPSRLYTTRMLEKYERDSRLPRDILGKAINNAKSVSKIIEERFATATPAAEFEVASVVAPTPALVAAKDDVMQEIKMNISTVPALSPMGASM